MNDAEIPIDNAVTKILESPAPILFPDTCFLVDLIRVLCRVSDVREAENTLQAAQQLLSKAQTDPPNLWIVILPPINIEWNEHSNKAVEKLRIHSAKLDGYTKVSNACAEAANVTSISSTPQLSSQALENALFTLSESFIRDSISLSEDPDYVTRAYARLVRKEAPARQGGSEMKDCSIIEHCLELCRQLRNAGFTEKCIFASSNKKDFCGDPGTPKAPLDTQLQSVNLMLTTNWRQTGGELRV